MSEITKLRAALSAGMADALAKDWSGDNVAPSIVEYLLSLPSVRNALDAPPIPRLDYAAGYIPCGVIAYCGRPERHSKGHGGWRT